MGCKNSAPRARTTSRMWLATDSFPFRAVNSAPVSPISFWRRAVICQQLSVASRARARVVVSFNTFSGRKKSSRSPSLSFRAACFHQ